MGGIIFVAGIHGVGKTTVCRELSLKQNISYYSASELISRVKKENFEGKQTKEINENQNLLKTAMDLHMKEDKFYLLDGLFCLIDSLGSIVRIAYETFKNIVPIAIIVIVDSIDNIVKRLAKRDLKEYDSIFIAEFQKSEIEYSKEIATQLNITCFTFNSSQEKILINDLIESWIK